MCPDLLAPSALAGLHWAAVKQTALRQAKRASFSVSVQPSGWAWLPLVFTMISF